jgi:hypothetical protein
LWENTSENGRQVERTRKLCTTSLKETQPNQEANNKEIGEGCTCILRKEKYKLNTKQSNMWEKPACFSAPSFAFSCKATVTKTGRICVANVPEISNHMQSNYTGHL